MGKRILKFNFLSGNALKIIATITMLIDHIGLIFFPNTIIFRIIGRVSFPIFAFFISEGCNHTRNRLKYFITVLICGIIGQSIFFIFRKGYFTLNILFTFSVSISVIYLSQWVKYTFYHKKQILSIRIC